MGKKLQPVEVVTVGEAGRHELPERVQAALGELVGAAQEACSPCRSGSASASSPS